LKKNRQQHEESVMRHIATVLVPIAFTGLLTACEVVNTSQGLRIVPDQRRIDEAMRTATAERLGEARAADGTAIVLYRDTDRRHFIKVGLLGTPIEVQSQRRARIAHSAIMDGRTVVLVEGGGDGCPYRYVLYSIRGATVDSFHIGSGCEQLRTPVVTDREVIYEFSTNPSGFAHRAVYRDERVLSSSIDMRAPPSSPSSAPSQAATSRPDRAAGATGQTPQAAGARPPVFGSVNPSPGAATAPANPAPAPTATGGPTTPAAQPRATPATSPAPAVRPPERVQVPAEREEKPVRIVLQ